MSDEYKIKLKRYLDLMNKHYDKVKNNKEIDLMNFTDIAMHIDDALTILEDLDSNIKTQ